MIELQHLSKSYGPGGGAAPAVHDLNLVFPEGEVTALIGPSGCGKTTTLRMINRLVEPTAGRVLLGGRDTRERRPEELRRDIGYAIQQVGLFPHLSVAQNVATVPELLGWDRRRTGRRVDELLDLVGLDSTRYRDARPGALSGGQAQRVGVARALAADPPVLLMDEPFGALDPLARDRLQSAFLDIQRRLRKTVVLVTHDLDEALRLGGRVALMHAGTLAQFGTPDDLIHRPASEFVREFLGEDAALRQLAGRTAAEFARPGDARGLPVVEASLDARSALGVMLREGVDRLAVVRAGQPAGVLRWNDLRTLASFPTPEPRL